MRYVIYRHSPICGIYFEPIPQAYFNLFHVRTTVVRTTPELDLEFVNADGDVLKGNQRDAAYTFLSESRRYVLQVYDIAPRKFAYVYRLDLTPKEQNYDIDALDPYSLLAFTAMLDEFNGAR